MSLNTVQNHHFRDYLPLILIILSSCLGPKCLIAFMSFDWRFFMLFTCPIYQFIHSLRWLFLRMIQFIAIIFIFFHKKFLIAHNFIFRLYTFISLKIIIFTHILNFVLIFCVFCCILDVNPDFLSIFSKV